jgi:hypothetical protein
MTLREQMNGVRGEKVQLPLPILEEKMGREHLEEQVLH